MCVNELRLCRRQVSHLTRGVIVAVFISIKHWDEGERMHVNESVKMDILLGFTARTSIASTNVPHFLGSERGNNVLDCFRGGGGEGKKKVHNSAATVAVLF